MHITLDNQIAIVTGASAGIGRCIAITLAEAGATVVVADLHDEPPSDAERTTVEVIQEASGEALFVETDVADGDSVAELVFETVDRFGGLDLLVNNAGISHEGNIEETTEAEWHHVLDVNLTGMYHTTHHAMTHLMESEAPRIVNIASQLAFVAQSRKPAYLASKGGVVGLTRSLALDYADVPVLVNAICPGVVHTELTKQLLDDPERRAALETETILPYLGKPEDIAAMAAFLVSEHARFITGQCFIVDGGYTAQ